MTHAARSVARRFAASFFASLKISVLISPNRPRGFHEREIR